MKILLVVKKMCKLSSSYSALCIVAPRGQTGSEEACQNNFLASVVGTVTALHCQKKKQKEGRVPGRIGSKAVNDIRNLNSLIPDSTLYDKIFNFFYQCLAGCFQ
jgi:hypothetical protein